MADETACDVPDDLEGRQTMKVFLYVPLPETTLAGGYNRIAIQRSKKGPNGDFIEITNSRTEIIIEDIKHNYWYIVDAEPTWLFKPVLRDSTGVKPDLVQVPRQAQSIEYEGVLTIEELKRIFLFGIDLTNDEGTPFPDEMLAQYIRGAISQIEHELDLALTPKVIIDEGYDYWQRDFANYGFVQLKNRPTLSVERFAIRWPGAAEATAYPITWVQLDPWSGQITLIPDNTIFTSTLLAVPGSSSLMLSSPYIPNIIRIDYTHGFALGAVPDALKEVIGMKASFGPLNVAGDLIAGAGIASKSLGIDGLSQSVSTTSSATNSGYGARIITYRARLKDDMKTLKSYYKGGRMTVA